MRNAEGKGGVERCILMLKPKFQKSFLKQQVNTTYMHISLKQVLQHKGTSILRTRTATILKKKYSLRLLCAPKLIQHYPIGIGLGKKGTTFLFLKKKNIHYKSKWQPT